jgi:protein gp37
MGSSSRIEWTDATWNPWMGCAKVSPGCAHCYMFTDQRRYGTDPAVVRRSKTRFDEPLRWKAALLVFTCSWSDWFIPAADGWRDEAWDVIRRTPHLTYQILTKRPELIADRLPADWGSGWPNVWLGTSIENRRFVQRADVLREAPATVRFISAEPLLGPLAGLRLEHIDWLIAGGESGPRARRCDPDWVRQLRDRCQAEGVAFFFKQWGSVRVGGRGKGGHDEALLDGRRWLEMPELIPARTQLDLPT